MVICLSRSVCAPGGVVYEARPGPECGEWPPGGVGRGAPVGAQHFQRRRARFPVGGAGEEEDFKCCGGEDVADNCLHMSTQAKYK